MFIIAIVLYIYSWLLLDKEAFRYHYTAIIMVQLHFIDNFVFADVIEIGLVKSIKAYLWLLTIRLIR